MADYWSLTEMYNKGKKKNGKNDKTKEKKGKKKDKKEEKNKKGGKSLFEESSKDKSETMQYGEFLKTKLTGIFEAKIRIKNDKKKVYIYRTEDMRYPNVFMDLSGQNFKDWVIDQIRNKDINPNKIMYSAEITKIDIPKDLFNILKDTHVICAAYAASTSDTPMDDAEVEELVEEANAVVEDIKDNQ